MANSAKDVRTTNKMAITISHMRIPLLDMLEWLIVLAIIEWLTLIAASKWLTVFAKRELLLVLAAFEWQRMSAT